MSVKTHQPETIQHQNGQQSAEERDGVGGLTISRRFTREGKNPFEAVEYEICSSSITNPDGSIIFRMDQLEIPKSWSQLATDIVASKYFRKAGVPGLGHETSVKQLIHRVSHTIRKGGEDLGGYFASEKDAASFEDELTYLLLSQRGAFNSPVWFNCGH